MHRAVWNVVVVKLPEILVIFTRITILRGHTVATTPKNDPYRVEMTSASNPSRLVCPAMAVRFPNITVSALTKITRNLQELPESSCNFTLNIFLRNPLCEVVGMDTENGF